MATIKNPVPVYWKDQRETPVFQQNRGSLSARSCRVPTNRRHLRQQRSRINLEKNIRIWRSLSASQKIDWNNFANTYTTTNKYGSTISISGYQWFNKFNWPLLLIGFPIQLTPPADPTGTYQPTIFSLGYSAGVGWQFSLDPPPNSTRVILWYGSFNNSLSITEAPAFMPLWLRLHNEPSSTVTIVPVSEFLPGTFRNFVRAVPYDNYGRFLGTITFPLEVTI